MRPFIRSTDAVAFDDLLQADAPRFLRAAWQGEDGLYSHRYADVVLRDHAIIALAIGYPGCVLPTLQRQTSAAMSPVQARCHDRVWRMQPPVPVPAYYVQCPAVAAPFQKRGIGGFLLEHAIRRAREAGCRSIHLDAAAGAPCAGFHRSLGMRIICHVTMLYDVTVTDTLRFCVDLD